MASPHVAADNDLAGMDSNNIPTNEQGVALRYFAGVARIAPTWLGPAYNQISKKVANTSKTTGTPTDFMDKGSQYQYYGDCAGVFCVGQVDVLKEVWYASRKIWEGDVERVVNGVATDFATVTTRRGVITLYWGTETQPIDPILAPFNHPAYRGQCYAVFKKLSFGDSADAAPQIEFVLERYPNTANLATQPQINHDCNPIHCVVELLTSVRFGSGWDVSALDLVSADAVANQLKYETLGVSPLLDRDQDAPTVLQNFHDYYDGYVVTDPTNGGKLKFGLKRPFTGNPAALPLLGEYDLTEPPDLLPQSWREVSNEFVVNFTDSANDYQSNGLTFVNLAARRITGDPLPTTLDRPWITTAAAAGSYGAYYVQVHGNPTTAASGLKVRKDSALGIVPGNFVRLTYANWNTTIIMRVERRKVDADRAQIVELDLVADGYFADITAYVADKPAKPASVIVEPEPPLYAAIIELPWPLANPALDRQAPQLAALVARASGLDVRLRIYSSDDGTTYDQVARTANFAVYGTLAAAYGLTNLLDDSAGGMLIDLPGPDGPDTVPSTDEVGRLAMELLLFCDGEILSYRDVDLVTATRVRLTGLRRACYDTVAVAHALNAPVLIIAADDLRPFTSASYGKNSVEYLKAATGTATASLDLSDAPEIDLTLINRTARPLEPLNLRVNGVGANPTYAAGANVLIEWDAASWRRHAFWDSWEEVYADPKLFHKVRIVDGNNVLRRKITVAAGVSSYNYAAADLAADFGGSAPATFQVQVYSRRRGIRSASYLFQNVTRHP